MRNSIVFALLVLGIVTAGASGAMSLAQLPVTNSGTNNANLPSGYHVQGITDDGAYVVATADAVNTYNNADGIMVIKVSDLSTAVYRPKVATSGRGIAMAPGGLMIAGAVGSNGALARAYDAGLGANYYLNTSTGGGSETLVAVQNALSVDPATGDGWLVGSRTHNKGPEACAWKYVGGVKTNINAFWQKQGIGVTDLNGVSNTGLAVGNDSDGNRAIYANVASNGNVTAIPLFVGATGVGQGNGMAANGAFASGYMVPGGSDDGLHAFRFDVVANSTSQLFPAGGDIAGLIQQANALDIANDGTAGGFTYDGKYADGTPFSGYRATVWLGGSTSGVLLEDLLAAGGVGLGGFSYLERIVSVTADGKTFAGRGVLTSDGSYRGFVVTIPEPATIGFLALGGLALLRRRR